MQIIPGALPNRRIEVSPPPTRIRLGAGLLLLFPLGLAAMLCWLIGAPLYRDVTAAADLESAKSVQFLEGRCRTKAFVLTSCRIKIGDTAPGGVGQVSLEYMMLNIGDRSSAEILRSAADPSYVTSDIGQDQLVNRIITLGVMQALFWGAGFMLLWITIRPRPCVSNLRR